MAIFVFVSTPSLHFPYFEDGHHVMPYQQDIVTVNFNIALHNFILLLITKTINNQPYKKVFNLLSLDLNKFPTPNLPDEAAIGYNKMCNEN